MEILAAFIGFAVGCLTTLGIYVLGWREGRYVGRAEGRSDPGRNVYD